jgi:ubiquinone/menaquinone biosynthesis C-methylase UbiE
MRWYTDTFLAKSTGARILEMGCGAGGIIEYLAKSNECFGVDVSKSGVAIAKSKGLNVQLLDLNVSRLPLHDEYFDFVLCIETIEHLSNPIFCLQEVSRVLKRNGRFIVTIPNPRWGHKIASELDFTCEGFKRFLEESNFEILQTRTWGVYMPSSLPIWRSILNNRYVRWGTKKLLQRLNPTRYSWTIVFLCSKRQSQTLRVK